MSRRLVGWMAIAAALAGGISGSPAFPRFVKRCGGRFGPYNPHQSARECARRVGGETWCAFKAGDRIRRGLPA